jgi:hypothetical protein
MLKTGGTAMSILRASAAFSAATLQSEHRRPRRSVKNGLFAARQLR